jgi:hypothetical protein
MRWLLLIATAFARGFGFKLGSDAARGIERDLGL